MRYLIGLIALLPALAIAAPLPCGDTTPRAYRVRFTQADFDVVAGWVLLVDGTEALRFTADDVRGDVTARVGPGGAADPTADTVIQLVAFKLAEDGSEVQGPPSNAVVIPRALSGECTAPAGPTVIEVEMVAP